MQNYRGFLNFDKKFGDFGVMAFVGGEYRKDGYKNISVSSYGAFNYDDFWSIDNTSDWPDWGNRGRVRGHNYGSKVLYAVMASATVSWKDQVYVEVQGRNDWSSTLDPNNNSYFYPGVAANWNFTNTYDISWLDFGKLRMAWADVGRPAPGYYYAYQSYSTGRINNSDAYTVNGPWFIIFRRHQSRNVKGNLRSVLTVECSTTGWKPAYPTTTTTCMIRSWV